MERKKLALDIDGCAANFIARALIDINHMFGRDHAHDDVTHFMIEKALGLDEAQTLEFYGRVMAEGWCATIPPYDGAVEAIIELKEIIDVHPVTSPFEDSGHWIHERLAWLREHLGIGKRDTVQTDSKHLVYADYFVEDRTAMLIKHRAFWRSRGITTTKHILFTRPYNINDDWDGIRVASWPELKGFIVGDLAASSR